MCILKTAVQGWFSLCPTPHIYFIPVSVCVSFFCFFVSGLFSGSGGKGQLLDTDVETGSMTHTIKKAHRLDKLSSYL
jgi:hypothetical protein